METVQLPVMENGFNGAGWAAGLGGLILGTMWGNGWGGFGGNRGQGIADVSLANAVEHVSDQVTQGTLAAMQQSSTDNMFLSGKFDAVTGAINQGTITDLQSNANLSEKLCGINASILTQGYQGQLLAQQLASQLQNQHAELMGEIFKEGCANRELQREIAAQAVRDKLAEKEAENAALKAQINLQGQLQSQTLYLIDQLKPAATA